MGDHGRKSRLQKTGKRSPLLEQELAHYAQVRAHEEEMEEQLGLDFAGHRISLKVLVPLVILAAAAVGFVLFLALRDGDKKPAKEESGVRERVRDSEVAIDEEAVTALPAIEVARNFLRAGTPAERMALARKTGTLEERLRRFPAELTVYPISYRTLHPMGVASASGELSFQRFAVTLADGSRRLLCVTATPEGPLVDFEALARYGTAEWDALLEGAPGEELRVVAKTSFYYNHQFADDQEWAAFDLSSPDWPDSLTGYAKRGSATAGVLAKIVGKAPRLVGKAPRQRVTLRIRPEGTSHQHRQFVIDKVLASGWVMTTGDLEEKWLRQQR